MRLAPVWPQRALFAVAVLLLSYCGLVQADAWLFQQRESRQFLHLLEGNRASVTAASFSPVVTTGSLVGRLEVSRLDLSVMVLQGGNQSVVSTKVVNPSDVRVLDPSENETLTLITCYPFYFVGAAPDRFIVRAARNT